MPPGYEKACMFMFVLFFFFFFERMHVYVEQQKKMCTRVLYTLNAYYFLILE